MNKYKYTEQQKDSIIKMYLDGISIKDICQQTKISFNTIYRILRRNNISRDRWKYELHKTDETYSKFIEEFVNQQYNPFLPNESNYSLCKHNYLDTFFDNINNQDGAYILGLLYADGNMNKEKYKVSITLQERDVKILEQISSIINKKQPLRFIKSKNPNWQNSYCLNINSKRICDALFHHGLYPNKSLILKFPVIPFEYYKDFIRGYFDGDGYLGVNGSSTKVTITSTKQFCEKLKLFIENYLEINCSIYKADSKNNVTYFLQIGGSNQVKKFLDYIYKDAHLYIERKYNDYLSMNNSLIA